MTMRRQRRSDPAFMVTRPDTHSGMVVKAASHEAATWKAMRYACMKGAARLSVRLFAGEVAGSRDTSPRFFDV